jgi:uncharacterized cupin superfamily protein
MTVRPIVAAEAPPRAKPSIYPALFAALMTNRVKHPLGDLFGLTTFGLNLVRLSPGGKSALHHRHTKQDEFVYVLEGTATLIVDDGEHEMSAGMCVGFKAGGTAHHMVNRGTKDVVYLEIGDRTPGDAAEYPHDDIAAKQDADGKWVFTHKDGTPW